MTETIPQSPAATAPFAQVSHRCGGIAHRQKPLTKTTRLADEFIPYDGVALGVLAVDVLVAFRGIESLGNIRRFCSALNPQIVVYGL